MRKFKKKKRQEIKKNKELVIKQKEVLDKINKYIKEKGLYSDYGDRARECEKDILELLEEIE